ncbi:hypothetical protein [Bradyrhizobium sp.]|uniref:hypothetical protein n=1 Tax=Bradyrhizobium sp. TaxID=376 RepID=UPI0040380E9D
MSFSTYRKGGNTEEPVFIVQSGVCMWEDPEPIVDWKRKTISVVASERSVAMGLLWAMVNARSKELTGVWRLFLAPMPASTMESQRRRLVAKLRVDPPGFVDTTVFVEGDRACVVSQLREESVVDPEFLTQYRHCAIVEVENSRCAETIRTACRGLRHLDGSGIKELLDNLEASVVLRVLGFKSCTVIQFVGSIEASELVARSLTSRGVRQLHDLGSLAQTILRT